MKTPKTLDRDLSWIYFNHRILQEAQRANVPLLERLSFLGIYSNNLDEFFRVRVSTMKRVAEYESGRSPIPKSSSRRSPAFWPSWRKSVSRCWTKAAFPTLRPPMFARSIATSWTARLIR